MGQLSESTIKAALKGTAGSVGDRRYVGLRLKINSARTGGSWYLAKQGKMHKIGTWPELSAKTIIGLMPGVRLNLASGAQVAGQAGWSTLARC